MAVGDGGQESLASGLGRGPAWYFIGSRDTVQHSSCEAQRAHKPGVEAAWGGRGRVMDQLLRLVLHLRPELPFPGNRIPPTEVSEPSARSPRPPSRPRSQRPGLPPRRLEPSSTGTAVLLITASCLQSLHVPAGGLLTTCAAWRAVSTTFSPRRSACHARMAHTEPLPTPRDLALGEVKDLHGCVVGHGTGRRHIPAEPLREP